MATTSARMLSLLSLLQARRDWPGAVLADRLRVSARTVRRDVDRLRELGYPIAALKGPDGGYRLEAGSDLPPLLFDDDQAIALAVALQLATTSGAGIEEAAARALATVRQVMPGRLRQRIDNVRVTAVGRTQAPLDPSVLTALSAAIHDHETLRFDYAAPASSPVPATVLAAPRRVQPHHLVVRGGRWYLVAWDLDRDDWRTFRADRISPRTPTGPRFTPRELPGGDVATFILDRFRGVDVGAGASGGWPCRGEVTLRLPAGAVLPYARDGVVEALTDDRCRLILGSWSWIGLAATLGQFDADLDDVAPAELRAACVQLAARLARAGVQ